MAFRFRVFFKSLRKEMGLKGLDAALSRISLIEDVVSTALNKDGTVTILVKGEVDKHYPGIVLLMQRHAPGVRGEVRRAPLASLATLGIGATKETLLQ